MSEYKEINWNCPYCGGDNLDVRELTVAPLCGDCQRNVEWDTIDNFMPVINQHLKDQLVQAQKEVLDCSTRIGFVNCWPGAKNPEKAISNVLQQLMGKIEGQDSE